MTNIVIFDLYSTSLLKKLYESFPQCITIITDNETDELKKELHSFQMNSKQIGTVYSETLYWLKSNGFINFAYPTERPTTPTTISEFNCVELTLKGLTLLKSPTPETLNTKKTLGEDISDKFKDGLIKEASKLTINAIMNFGGLK